ncbi:MAG TPA: hypothetical protein VGC54_11240, partial [Planctomycetota bacterium]
MIGALALVGFLMAVVVSKGLDRQDLRADERGRPTSWAGPGPEIPLLATGFAEGAPDSGGGRALGLAPMQGVVSEA